MTDLDELERLLAKATEGPWRVIDYDCGDTEHYDHNGPCPSIQAPDDQDCAIVHWDGFKQKYWSAANGNQRQIEANAALIVALRNAAPAMIAELKALRRALEYLSSFGCPKCGGDCSSANPPMMMCPMLEAKAALAPSRP